MSSGNKDKKSKKLLFMMIFALLLLNAGLFYVIFANKQEADKQRVELVDTQAEVTELEELTEELRVNLESKTGKNAQLDSIIRVRDTELQAQVQRVRNMLSRGNLTKSELAKAKKEAVTYLVDNQIVNENSIQNALIMSQIWLAHQIGDSISINDIMIYLGNTDTPANEEIDEIILDDTMGQLTLTEVLEAAVMK